ncbi:MAG: carbohydrate binding domain-containing protein [Oscillospiraceae bacterium]|nr:carbohydrate binding domain-containing protein [Oscillospiraceae bacterium]
MRSGKVVAGLFSLLMCGSMAFSAFSETGNLQVDADSSDFYFRDSFESSTDDWSGRGAVSFDVSTKYAYAGNSSLLVSDRTSAWNGVFKALDPKVLFRESHIVSVQMLCIPEGLKSRFSI